MKNFYEEAIQGVERLLGTSAEESLERVEALRGGAVMLTARSISVTPGTHEDRWFKAEGASLRELHPCEDDALPLCRSLAAELRSGEARVRAWRPGRRICIELEEQGQTVFRKGYRKRRLAAARMAAGIAADVLNADEETAEVRGRLRTPTILATDEATASITFGRIAGQAPTLDTEAMHIFERLGRGLRQLQRAPAVSAALDVSAVPTHDRKAEHALLVNLAQRIGAVASLPVGWESIHARLLHSEPPVWNVPAVLCHRDLHDGQLLVDREKIGLVDFDLLALSAPTLDLANLSVHLKLRALQGISGAQEAHIDVLSRALFDGYAPEHDPAFLPSLRFYQTTAFLRLALIYHLRPRWRALAPELIHMAKRCIDEM